MSVTVNVVVCSCTLPSLFSTCAYSTFQYIGSMIKSVPNTISSIKPILSKMTIPINEYPSRFLQSENNGLVHVSTPLLLATALPLVIMAIIGHKIDYSLSESLGVGVIRSFVQLMMLGVVLHPIFKWGMEMPWVVGLCKYFIMSMMLDR